MYLNYTRAFVTKWYISGNGGSDVEEIHQWWSFI